MESSNRGSNFNPLPRKEGDPVTAIQHPKTQTISIHSLVKRETQDRRVILSDIAFQSTPS